MSEYSGMFEGFTDIAKLNDLIGRHVKQHMPDIEIRFDEPDPAHPPASPTLHLFMYLIHEDLAIRQSSRNEYNPATGGFVAEDAYIRCLYLVTYWDNLSSGGADAPGAQPDSPTVRNLTAMLKALLCMRNHGDFKAYMLRVIEPEALNSLGNFWQALGNKPRAIINFAVTLPVSTEHPDEQEPIVPPVQSIEQQLRHFGGAGLPELEAYLFAELHQAVGAQQAELALKKVVIDIRRVVPETRSRRGGKEQDSAETVSVLVAGVTFSAQKATLENQVTSWQDKTYTLGDQAFQVKQVTHALIAPGSDQ
jgi:hypothetical protein